LNTSKVQRETCTLLDPRLRLNDNKATIQGNIVYLLIFISAFRVLHLISCDSHAESRKLLWK